MLAKFYFGSDDQQTGNPIVILGLIPKILIGAAFVLNCGLIFLFMQLEADYSTWWAPVLLLDIVMQFTLFAKAVQEWYGW